MYTCKHCSSSWGKYPNAASFEKKIPQSSCAHQLKLGYAWTPDKDAILYISTRATS